jgi:prepilin-type N-terminal cleavage/methylation domain-containing protein
MASMNLTRKIRGNRAKGFTLIETMIAMAILSFGILSLAAVYSQGLRISNVNQVQFIAQQKAQQALESIYTARNTGYLSWAQIANVSGSGVFLDNPQPLYAPGPDGIVGTADDDASKPDGITTGPGPDRMLGTADDVITKLNPWMTRTIAIAPVTNFPNLKTITITINYKYEGRTYQFTLQSLISSYS